MSTYSTENPVCEKCGTSLNDTIAVMVRPVRFYTDDKRFSPILQRWQMSPKRHLFCTTCMPLEPTELKGFVMK